MSNKFTLKLLVNNKKKDAIIVKDKDEGKRKAEEIEGERLFWMGNKAYGKVNSYRFAVEVSA